MEVLSLAILMSIRRVLNISSKETTAQQNSVEKGF